MRSSESHAGDSPYEACYPLVGLIATLGLGFGPVLATYAYDSWQEVARLSDQSGIRINTSHDGHFRPTAIIGDRTLPFLIDFTAEQLILTREDAKYLGINTFALRFDREVAVQQRPLKGAGVILPSFRIASLSLSNVPAIVSKDPIPYSVIGVGILDRFGRWYVDRDGVVVQPRSTRMILWNSEG